MRILVFADSNWRDSFSVSLVKYQLQKLIPRADILVSSFDIAFPVVESFKPHIMLINHVMGKRNKKLSDYVKRQGGLSIILPTEGVPRSQEVIEWFAEQNDNSRFADAYLSWNSQIADRFQEVKTFVTGCPRFDIYQEPYNSLIDSRDIFFDKYSLDKDKDLLLFTSSFPQSKFAYRGKQFNRADWKDLGVTKVEGDADKYAQREYERLQEYMLWIRMAHNNYKDRLNIAIKPHPLEDILEWQRLSDELNITLLKGEYIFNAIANSILLVGKAGCLTHQDAWLAGINSFHALLQDEVSGPTKESIKYGFSVVDDAWELSNEIEWQFSSVADIDHQRNIDEWQEYLNKWGFSTQNSGQRVAEAVVKLIKENNPQVEDITIEDWQRINHVIAKHNAENKVLRQDGLGHFGKAVTRNIVDNWTRRIDAV